MILAIDIGNSFTKIAVFDGFEMVHVEQHIVVNTEVVDIVLNRYHITKSIIATVKRQKEAWQLNLPENFDVIDFNLSLATGIKIHYLSPETLGVDRLAAVIGAIQLFPGVNNLVIGGGTCITYDWVDAAGNYFGGSISPGLNMRYKALNDYTAGLPLIKADTGFVAAFGNNTTSAILSGVQNGIKHELTGFIESYKMDGKVLNIILTGGDSIFFDTLLKNSIFAPCVKIEPYLVLKGLNTAILNNND